MAADAENAGGRGGGVRRQAADAAAARSSYCSNSYRERGTVQLENLPTIKGIGSLTVLLEPRFEPTEHM